MATNENSRSKLGSKREVAPGKWVIRVQAGFRADGHVRRVSRTVYGTETEADIAIAQLAQEQLGSLRGCDAHFSVIISEEDIKLYKRLGIHVTCEPRYEVKKLYHK